MYVLWQRPSLGSPHLIPLGTVSLPHTRPQKLSEMDKYPERLCLYLFPWHPRRPLCLLSTCTVVSPPPSRRCTLQWEAPQTPHPHLRFFLQAFLQSFPRRCAEEQAHATSCSQPLNTRHSSHMRPTSKIQQGGCRRQGRVKLVPSRL